jgi:hypothetical protein
MGPWQRGSISSAQNTTVVSQAMEKYIKLVVRNPNGLNGFAYKTEYITVAPSPTTNFQQIATTICLPDGSFTDQSSTTTHD